jgi:hypothetical protein
MGLTRNAWKDMHNYVAFALTALIILHLLLHLKYFRTVPACFRTNKREE